MRLGSVTGFWSVRHSWKKAAARNGQQGHLVSTAEDPGGEAERRISEAAHNQAGVLDLSILG